MCTLCLEHALSPFPSNTIRASSAASTPSATLFPVTCLVLGGSSPSLIPATGFAFARGLVNPPRLYTLHPTLYKKKRIALAYIKNMLYLCTAFSVREAGESPAQSRCCDSQSDVQILISHWLTVNCQLLTINC